MTGMGLHLHVGHNFLRIAKTTLLPATARVSKFIVSQIPAVLKVDSRADAAFSSNHKQSIQKAFPDDCSSKHASGGNRKSNRNLADAGQQTTSSSIHKTVNR